MAKSTTPGPWYVLYVRSTKKGVPTVSHKVVRDIGEAEIEVYEVTAKDFANGEVLPKWERYVAPALRISSRLNRNVKTV